MNLQLQTEILILAIQLGDTGALERLIGLWEKQLWRLIFTVVHDETAAWDVSQEAWISISGKITSLADPKRFRPWACRIAVNKARDSLRRKQRRTAVHREAAAAGGRSLFDEGPSSPEDRFQQVIEGLSEKDRVILTLRYEQDFSIAEISEAMSVPEGTVKSRLYHTRQKVKQILEDQDHDSAK